MSHFLWFYQVMFLGLCAWLLPFVHQLWGKNCFLRVFTFLPKPHLPTEPLSTHPPLSHSTFHNLNLFDLPIYSIKACPLLQVYTLCNDRAQSFPLLLSRCLGHSLTNACEMGSKNVSTKSICLQSVQLLRRSQPSGRHKRKIWFFSKCFQKQRKSITIKNCYSFF